MSGFYTGPLIILHVVRHDPLQMLEWIRKQVATYGDDAQQLDLRPLKQADEERSPSFGMVTPLGYFAFPWEDFKVLFPHLVGDAPGQTSTTSSLCLVPPDAAIAEATSVCGEAGQAGDLPMVESGAPGDLYSASKYWHGV